MSSRLEMYLPRMFCLKETGTGFPTDPLTFEGNDCHYYTTFRMETGV